MPIKIIIADEYQLMRWGLICMLRSETDIQIIGQADNGIDAMKLATQLVPDVMLLDIGLPLLNGIDVTRNILSTKTDTKIIGLSADVDEKHIVGILKAGALGYITKNSSCDDLIKAIRTVSSGKTFLSDEITGSVLKHLFDKNIQEKSDKDVNLSAREREVLQLIAEGKSTKDIAALLNISQNTVIRHRQKITERLGLSGVAELTRFAIREGLTTLK